MLKAADTTMWWSRTDKTATTTEMAQGWPSLTEILQDWGDGTWMRTGGDIQEAGRTESPALLRPSLLLSSLMKVLPGKDGDSNGVSTKFLRYRSFTKCATPTLWICCVMTFVFRYAQLPRRRWREGRRETYRRVSNLHPRAPAWWAAYVDTIQKSNYLHQKSSNYSSTFTGLIISGGWPGSPHGYIRTAAEGLSSIETFVESGKPNCSVPDLPLGELSTQSSHENSTPAGIVGLLVHYWIGWMFPIDNVTQFLGRIHHTMSVLNKNTLVVCGGFYTTDTCISWSKDSPDNVWEFFALLRYLLQLIDSPFEVFVPLLACRPTMESLVTLYTSQSVGHSMGRVSD